jgi:hypothetical protein
MFVLSAIKYIFFASKALVFSIGIDNAPAWDHIIKDDLSKLEVLVRYQYTIHAAFCFSFRLGFSKYFSSTDETLS